MADSIVRQFHRRYPYADDLGREPTADAARRVLADDQVVACWQARRGHVLSRPWHVEPASDDSRDQEAAALVRAVLERLDYDAISAHLLEAVLWGRSGLEIVWSTAPTDVAELVPIPPRALDRRADRWILRLGEEIAIPSEKIIAVVYRPGSIVDGRGRGLIADLDQLVRFKRDLRQFAAAYADKFGIPTVVGRVAPGTDEQTTAQIHEVLQRIVSDSTLVVPQDVGIETFGPASGSFDFVALLDHVDRAIARLILGQEMTTMAGSSRAQAEVHQDTARWLAVADAALVDRAVNDQLVTRLVALTMPGARPPRVYRDMEDPEDLQARVQRDEILYRIGYRLRPEAVRDAYGDHYEPISAAPPASPEPVAELAEVASADPIDRLADRLDRRAAPHVAELIETIVGLADDARDLHDLRARIVALWPDLDRRALELALAEYCEIATIAATVDVHDHAAQS